MPSDNPNGSQYTELVAVIGHEATERLVHALPGTRWYIPASIQDDHPITGAIGQEQAAALTARLHGTTLEIPTGEPTRRQARNARILDLFDAGHTTREIALVVRLSQRAVRGIIARENQRQ